jgi:signal peptidase I
VDVVVAPERTRSGPLHRLGWSAAIAAGALLAVAGLTGSLSVATIESDSMAPTYCPGGRVLVWSPGASERAGRGDVVTARDPRGEGLLLKRVAAVGGQRVAVRDGVLRVDGEPVREPYVDPATVDGTFFGPVVVPVGSVFLLGDGRERSVDSRDFGPVEREDLTGTVLFGLGGTCPPPR